MSDGKGNVLPFRRAKLPPADAEIVETILMLHFGKEILIADVELSSRSLDEIAKDMGEPDAQLRGFLFPSMRWTDPTSRGRALWTVVIDTGSHRAFYTGDAPLSSVHRS